MLDTFGIDIKILLAQFLSFSVFFVVLYKYGIKPTSAFLDKRSNKIAKSLNEAEQAKVSVEKAHEKKEKIIQEAKAKAEEIIDAAKAQADKIEANALDEAKKKTEIVINDAKEIIAREKASMLKQVRMDLASLVVKGVQKIFGEGMNSKHDNKFTELEIRKVLKDENFS